MSLDPHKVKVLQDELERILSPQLMRILEAAEKPPGPGNPFFVYIPTANDMDLSAEDLASLVALASNKLADAAYNAGVAKAEMKRAESNYKIKYKTNLTGKNPSEREANAMAAAQDEFVYLSMIESLCALAEGQQTAAQVASESARKILDKVQMVNIAHSRAQYGKMRDEDFDNQK